MKPHKAVHRRLYSIAALVMKPLGSSVRDRVASTTSGMAAAALPACGGAGSVLTPEAPALTAAQSSAIDLLAAPEPA